MQVSLLYASNSMQDVLLKSSLDAMAAGSDGKLKVKPHAPEHAHTSQLCICCHAQGTCKWSGTTLCLCCCLQTVHSFDCTYCTAARFCLAGLQ